MNDDDNPTAKDGDCEHRWVALHRDAKGRTLYGCMKKCGETKLVTPDTVER